MIETEAVPILLCHYSVTARSVYIYGPSFKKERQLYQRTWFGAWSG